MLVNQLYPIFVEKNIDAEPLREFLSANMKARRKALNISQEELAELADVSVQMVKAIEGSINGDYLAKPFAR
jgi:DNA-binding XRE family transcriptional regulator